MLPFSNLLSSVVCRFSVSSKLTKTGLRVEFQLLQKAYSTSSTVYNPAKAASPPERHTRYPKIYKGFLRTMKLDSEHYKSLFTPELLTLSKLFTQNGYEIRMAGGAVRDLLMDKKPADIDFATTATPEEMKSMFERESIRMINMRGEKHGTITARINDKENFEITTLRIDVSTDGRHAEVEFTKNWELDAGRRDLTINSMFLDLDGTVYDYFNGMEDLKNLVIRFVGDPADRIQEDYLRILRYFRFYGRIIPTSKPASHEEKTLKAIRENADGLKQISGERLWTEFRKILLGNHAVELVPTMLEVGVGIHMGMPKDPNIEEFKILREKFTSLNLQINAATALCALLRSEKDVVVMHARLKLSTFERDLCFFLVENRVKIEGDDTLKYYQSMLLVNPQINVLVLRSYIEELLKYKCDLELLKQLQEWKLPKFPVSGHAILERGITGRGVTSILLALRERWTASDFTLTEQELTSMIPELKELHVKPETNVKPAKQQKK